MLLPPLPSILPLLLLTLPTQTHSTPSPPILYESEIHLMPRNVLFYRRQAADLQTFKSNLGGVSASPITNSGDAKRPFSVDGDTFTDFATAAQRSCDKQANACSKAANDGGNKGGLKVSDCDQQKSQCNDAQKAATVTSFGNNNGNNNNGGNNNNNNNGGNNNGGNNNNNNNNGGNAAAQSPTAIASTNIGPDPLFPDFDLICDA